MRSASLRVVVALAIAFGFAATMYTTNGCGGIGSSPTAPSPFAAVRGTVTDAVTGRPVTNATVVGASGSLSVQVTSGADGMYFLGLTPGSIRVTVTASGYQTYMNTITAVEGSNRLDIALMPR